MRERADSPVIGTTVMIVITLLLASVVSVGAVGVADVSTEQRRVDSLTDGTATPVPDLTNEGDDAD